MSNHAIEAGIDSATILGLGGVNPFPPKTTENNWWYRSRVLKMRNPDWGLKRIKEEIEKQTKVSNKN